jgi:hypothetical protein
MTGPIVQRASQKSVSSPATARPVSGPGDHAVAILRAPAE